MMLQRDGAQLFERALGEGPLRELEEALSALPPDRPGVRIRDLFMLSPMLAADGPIGRVAAQYLGVGCRPVRTILFDKSEATNWALGWHQDRTIAVAEKVDVPGYGPWSVKAGIPHDEPPNEIQQSMVTLRVHLDDVDANNAPLLIAPGSHQLGRISEPQIDATVERYGTMACLAKRGDIWAYSTLILHASDVAHRPRRRRVLQVDYSETELSEPLRFTSATDA